MSDLLIGSEGESGARLDLGSPYINRLLQETDVLQIQLPLNDPLPKSIRSSIRQSKSDPPPTELSNLRTLVGAHPQPEGVSGDSRLSHAL